MLAGCVVVEGPCTVAKGNVVCTEGGRVHVIAPERSIEATGKAAQHIAKEIAADPAKVDPRLLVKPRDRR